VPERAAERAGPGRPSSGARERVLEAALEVLKSDGYAGLTTAKVAARAGQNKALISYHFGSKQGLIAAAARELRDQITAEVLEEVRGARTVEQLARGALRGLWNILDRDERLARVYFDLAAVSVVEDDARAVMTEMKLAWRAVVAELLAEAEDAPAPDLTDAAALYVLATLEGLALERVDRGETPELARARELFVAGAVAAVSA
jgi:AcrR family transcriptional regulator